MRLSRSARRQRALEDEVLRQREQLRSEQVVTPCELHPSWRVTISKTKLAPPSHMCPFCIRGELGNRPQRKHERREVDHPVGIDRLKPGQWDLMQDALEKHPRHRDIDRLEEDDALAAIDEAREADIESIERKNLGPSRGTLVSGRIEGSEWVEYRALPKLGIVRVTPSGVS